MWTAKRLVMLASGFAVFLSAYVSYGMTFLGGIDGLPPLPVAYQPPDADQVSLPPIGPRGNKLEQKLRQSFGDDAPELTRPIRIEMRSKNLLMAADQFQIEPDGRICLSPLSLAVFGKDKPKAKAADINSLRCQTAYLKFDRPVTNLGEIAGRKLVGAEFSGNIQITNNRATPERDDDLCIFIGAGPVFYQESDHLIWTKDTIHLTDHSSKPKPMEVRGKGMEMELVVGQPEAAAARHKPGKNEQVNGVKKITLLADVDIHMYVDAKSGFPGTTRPAETPAKPDAPAKPGSAAARPQPAPEKAHVTINTPGRFQYQLFKDHDEARFDLPQGLAAANSPLDVTVIRHNEQLGLIDQLVCQQLDLRLSRKQKKSEKEAATSPEQGLTIETARATGPEVTLKSDAEKLAAFGNEFFYDALKLTTTLKGEPGMVAVKEGNTIRAREMQIQDQKLPAQAGQPARSFQQATAIGPVTIDMIDKSSGVQKPVNASCTEKLISTKDGPNDLLILSGSARFTDDEHHQHLQADVLKVWLTPNERDPADKPTTQPANAAQPGRRPQRIEGLGNVVAVSPELNIHDTARLAISFRDVPVEALPDNSPRNTGKPAAPAVSTPKTTAAEPSGTANTATGSKPAAPANTAAAQAPAKNENPQRPLDLSARSVEATVLRSGQKNQLEKLFTEGSVQVHQDPAKPDEKGVDVKGDTLEMTYHPEGNFLVVTGDLAQLRLDKLYILGPEVNIDQAANKAWVNGIGAMQMESATTLQGGKLERPTPLTVHWNKSMLFNGKFAEFHGGIQAEQENSRLAGQSLQVFFDRAISLKGGNKQDQPAKVQNLVCDRDVRVEEAIYENGKLVRYQRMQAPTVVVTQIEPDDEAQPAKQAANPGNEVRASGPGQVRIMQRGNTETPAGSRPAGSKPAGAKPASSKSARNSAKPAAAATEQEMKLTHVQFLKNMYANSKTNTAIFLENVRVLHMPADDPNMEIDLDVILDRMPEGAMYLRCDRLDVFSRGEKGRGQQEMLAKGRCLVQARKFSGRAHTVTFNEAKDQIIFEGGDDGPAVVYKVERDGDRPQEIRAQKIIYIRKTGETKVDRVRSFDGKQD